MSGTRVVMGVAPVSRGFGVCILGGRGELIYSCVKEIRVSDIRKNAAAFEVFLKLLEKHGPTLLVLEDEADLRYPKKQRIRDLLELMEGHAVQHGVAVARRGRDDLRRALGLKADATKQEVAKRVARRLPSLWRQLPRAKQCWDAERYSMSIFVAAALALSQQESELNPAIDSHSKSLPGD
jgi:hypothetical protein